MFFSWSVSYFMDKRGEASKKSSICKYLAVQTHLKSRRLKHFKLFCLRSHMTKKNMKSSRLSSLNHINVWEFLFEKLLKPFLNYQNSSPFIYFKYPIDSDGWEEGGAHWEMRMWTIALYENSPRIAHFLESYHNTLYYAACYWDYFCHISVPLHHEWCQILTPFFPKFGDSLSWRW